jgi:hypothetical protein
MVVVTTEEKTRGPREMKRTIHGIPVVYPQYSPPLLLFFRFRGKKPSQRCAAPRPQRNVA